MSLSSQQKRRAQVLQQHGMTLREIAANIGAAYEDVTLWLYGGVADWESTAARKDVPGKTTVRDALAQIGDDPVTAAQPPASEEAAFASTGDSIRKRVPEASSPAGIQAPPVDAALPQAGADPAAAEDNDESGGAATTEESEPETAQQNTQGESGTAREAPGGKPTATADIGTLQQEALPAPHQSQAKATEAEPPEGTAPKADGVASRLSGGSGTAAPHSAPGPAAPPAGPRYRLVDELGEYLHKSGVGMTRHASSAWEGSEAQLAEALARCPHLKRLDPEPVR